jgi:hypothetical protein
MTYSSEKIVETDMLATAFNRDRGLGAIRRIVILECGHRVVTRNRKSAPCARCDEMLRRSIDTGEEDYDAFRHHGAQDLMAWEADPLRVFNEPHDLGGTPLRSDDHSRFARSEILGR